MCLAIRIDATPKKADRDIIVTKWLDVKSCGIYTPFQLERIIFVFGRTVQKYSDELRIIPRRSRDYAYVREGIYSKEVGDHWYHELYTPFIAKIPKGTNYLSSNLDRFGLEQPQNDFVSNKLVIYKSVKWYKFYKRIGL